MHVDGCLESYFQPFREDATKFPNSVHLRHALRRSLQQSFGFAPCGLSVDTSPRGI